MSRRWEAADRRRPQRRARGEDGWEDNVLKEREFDLLPK